MAHRFPGDPGHGNLHLGWNIEGTLKEHLSREITKLEAYSNGVSCRPNIWREFDNVGEDSFAAGEDGQLAVAKGMVVLITWEIGTPSNGQKYLNGDYDAWISKMIYHIRRLGNEYNAKIWWNHSNEPDKEDVYKNSSSARKILRNVHMYTYHKFKGAGLNNVMMTSPTYVPMTFHNAQSLKDDNEGWWAEYYPTYKGSTSTNSAFNINLGDFNNAPCLVAINQYCWHGMDGALEYRPQDGSWTWDEAEYRSHQLTNTITENKHMYQCLQAAKALGTFIAIGEWGWPVHESQNDSYPVITRDHWANTLIPEMIDNRVVSACLWKQVKHGFIADVRTSALAMGGRHSNESVSNHRGQVDPNDCRRKALADCFQVLSA